MHREIFGNITVKETRFMKKNRRFWLLFTRDRIVAVKSNLEIAQFVDDDSGVINRSKVLSADGDNFELPVIQIKEVVMKKGGISLFSSGCSGKIQIQTYDTTIEYEIESGQQYRDCVKLVQSVLEDKVKDRSPAPAVKYCPECRGEFQEWVTHCPDCGAVLVDELPLPVPNFGTTDSNIDIEWDGTMVSIAVAPNEIVAGMWKGLLDEQGIPCMIKRVGSLLHSRYYSPGVGNCEIMIKPSQAKKAFQILEPFLDV